MRLKSIYIFLLIMTLFFLGHSQCPDAPIILTSQQEIDDFSNDYPGCVSLINNITISGSDITDLTPLAVLESIDALSVENNPLLVSLAGLENVLDITGNNALDDGPYLLEISNNNLLEDISALTNVNQISTDLVVSVHNNPSLLSLQGLEWILSTGDIIAIRNNDSLTNLSGLDGLMQCEAIAIENNDSLLNLIGLGSLLSTPDLIISNNPLLNDISALDDNFVFGSLSISDNTSLSLCSISPICEYIESFPNQVIISNNSSGCQNAIEISLECGIVPSNDECEDATQVSIGETIIAYNELGTASPQIPSCNDVNRIDIWFNFNTGSFTSIDIIVESGFNIQLWEGTCSNLTQVDNACGESPLINASVNANSNYFIQVWSDSTTGRSTGLFNLLIQDATLSTEDSVFQNFKLFPIPSNGILNLESQNNIDFVSIYNLTGQQILSVTPNTTDAEINISSLDSGIYLMSISIDNNSKTYRILKK